MELNERSILRKDESTGGIMVSNVSRCPIPRMQGPFAKTLWTNKGRLGRLSAKYRDQHSHGVGSGQKGSFTVEIVV